MEKACHATNCECVPDNSRQVFSSMLVRFCCCLQDIRRVVAWLAASLSLCKVSVQATGEIMSDAAHTFFSRLFTQLYLLKRPLFSAIPPLPPTQEQGDFVHALLCYAEWVRENGESRAFFPCEGVFGLGPLLQSPSTVIVLWHALAPSDASQAQRVGF